MKKTIKYQDTPSDNIRTANEPMSLYRSDSNIRTNPLSMIRSARAGVAMTVILQLSHQLALSLQELSRILHVSLRTLQRYGSTKVLDSDSSSKAIQLELLHQRGVEVFGDSDSFSLWLHSIVPTLDNHRPLDYLDTPFGFELINQMLGRIEHGIFA